MKKLLLFSSCLFFFACKQQTSEAKKKEIDKMIILATKLSSPANPAMDLNKGIALYIEAEKRSEAIGYKEGLMASCKYLMKKLIDGNGDNEKSLTYGEKTEKLAQELNDDEVLAEVHEFRGSAYRNLGLNSEAYNEFQIALSYYIKNHQHLRSSSTYLKLASYAEATKAPQDTLLSYFKKSLYEIEQLPENDKNILSMDEKYYMLSFIHIQIGMFYTGIYKPQQPELAEKYLLEALHILETKKIKTLPSKIILLNALGSFYEYTQQPQKAIPYCTEVLKLEKKSKHVNERLTAYMVLANSYDALKSKDSTLQYTQLYSDLSDSISVTQKKITDNTLKGINTQKDISYNNSIFKILTSAILAIIAVIFIGGLYLRQKNRKVRKNYEKLVEKLNVNTSNTENTSKVEKKSPAFTPISDETLASILSKLNKFESSDKYLKKNINLSSLAHSLNTNQRYLTEIIKIQKGKSFSNYINGLKIEYITQKLYDDPHYLEYKISYLAEECGFASHQVFITVFKKETGVTPSYFIGNLKKNKQTQL